MINVKKIAKVAAIVGGISVLSEVSGIIGESQALYAMSGRYPDEVDKMFDEFDEVSKMNEYGGRKVRPFNRFKAKAVSKLSRWVIDNDIYG